MPRIAIDVYAFVEDLLAEFRLATRSGEWTPTFFSTASFKTESEEPEQIGDCLRLENRLIQEGREESDRAPAVTPAVFKKPRREVLISRPRSDVGIKRTAMI